MQALFSKNLVVFSCINRLRSPRVALRRSRVLGLEGLAPRVSRVQIVPEPRDIRIKGGQLGFTVGVVESFGD